MQKLLVILCSIICLSASAQLTTSSTFYFEFGSTQLTEVSKHQLSLFITQIQQKPPTSIIISGYTDSTGSFEYNQKLSYDRAVAILLLLKPSLAIEAKVSLNNFGSSSPASIKDGEQHLNRRVEVTIYYVTDSVMELQAFKEDVQEQRFAINLDDTVEIRAGAGSFIKIAPGSIQNKQGILIKGNAELVVKEYYSPSQILLAGLNSVSEQGLLQTGGMLYFQIFQNGDTMDRKTRKPIEIRMPKINPELDNMNVFTLSNDQDTAMWNNTGRRFNDLKSFWDMPYSDLLNDIFYESDFFYTRLTVGRRDEREYYLWNPLLNIRRWPRPHAKKVQLNVLKQDSNTLLVHAKIKYRPRGYKAFGRRNLDTTFQRNFIRSQYVGFTGEMNWINCDRFYDYKNKIEFYVNTPGYKGLAVLVYFKSINAYLPANAFTNKYVVKNVPSNMPVILIAIGKKGDEFYFGKQEFTSTQKGLAIVTPAKVSEEEFRNAMKSL